MRLVGFKVVPRFEFRDRPISRIKMNLLGWKQTLIQILLNSVSFFLYQENINKYFFLIDFGYPDIQLIFDK